MNRRKQKASRPAKCLGGFTLKVNPCPPSEPLPLPWWQSLCGNVTKKHSLFPFFPVIPRW
jgi:hypothetical protein